MNIDHGTALSGDGLSNASLAPGRCAPNKTSSRARWRCADGGATARRTGDVKKMCGKRDSAADRGVNDPMQRHGRFRQTLKVKQTDDVPGDQAPIDGLWA